MLCLISDILKVDILPFLRNFLRMSYFCTFSFLLVLLSFYLEKGRKVVVMFTMSVLAPKEMVVWPKQTKINFLEDRPPSSFAVEWVKPVFRLFQYTVSQETANVYSLQHWAAVFILLKEGTARAKEQGCSRKFPSLFSIKNDGGEKSFATKSARPLLKINNAVKGPGWLFKNWDIVITGRQWALAHGI